MIGFVVQGHIYYFTELSTTYIYLAQIYFGQTKMFFFIQCACAVYFTASI